jgi:hypothetical protein
MALKVKPEFKDTVIGFNNSGLPLGQREDLQTLYDLAKANNREDYLAMFEGEPETEKEKAEKFNAKQANKNTGK